MANTTARDWTEAELQTLRERNAAGDSLTAIARDLGVTKPVLSRKAAALGLTWDRSRTEKATAAKVVDAKARRATILGRLYGEAEAVLDDLEAGRAGKGWNTIIRGEYGIENTRSLDFIPIRDRRDASDTLSRVLVQATRLEQVDNGTADAVKGLLGGLADQLGLTHEP